MIHIEVAGFATIQDRGRIAHQRDAVPVSGPADPFAHAAANALVGNAPRDATIEIVGLPFVFTSDDARVVAVTGRDVRVTVRDRVPSWTSVFVRSGERVTIDGAARTRYAYLAVSGGVASDVILGSRSAYPRAGIGRALQRGDALRLGQARRSAEDAGHRVQFEYGDVVRAMPGPHLDRFDDGAVARFFAEPFVMTAHGDRQGVRLEGPSIAPRSGEILTCGVVAGAVQVPRGGQPIVLLADHQTTGGYPIVATVCEADLGLVAQRAPGESLRFYRVERDEALERGRALRRSLDSA
ncbi:MAG TPA: biotin-dependent carboxyltransferase family protein [Candidatus Limnocylindria bacterium]